MHVTPLILSWRFNSGLPIIVSSIGPEGHKFVSLIFYHHFLSNEVPVLQCMLVMLFNVNSISFIILYIYYIYTIMIIVLHVGSHREYTYMYTYTCTHVYTRFISIHTNKP